MVSGTGGFGFPILQLTENSAYSAATDKVAGMFFGALDSASSVHAAASILGVSNFTAGQAGTGYIAFRTKGTANIDDIPANVERMRITSSGNVVIGTTAASAQLHTTGTVRFANFGAGTATFDASGNITSVSDERMKVIQGPFTPGLTALMGLRPILYHYTAASGLDTENNYAGFSAQNVLGYIPEAVGKNLDGLYSLNIVPVLAATVTAVQELAGEVDELRAAMKMQPKVRAVVKVADERRIVNSATPKRLAEVAKQKADADKAKADKLAANAKAKIIK